jgi:predicted RNA-binding Zn-ribbon protein involved in translation (DUF1610 family)
MTLEVDEFHPAPLVCPRCDQEFEYIEDEVHYSCENCGHSIDNIQAQFAYSRGYDAFFAGQIIYLAIPPSRRGRQAYEGLTREATQLFKEAYTAIQEAFQSYLAESQRVKAIEIMASISVLFMQLNFISPLEANYWTSLMTEQVNQNELDEINQKLAQPQSGIPGFLKRITWHRRKRQLEKGLEKVGKKIQLIEQNIAFITPPHVHRLKKKRLGR